MIFIISAHFRATIYARCYRRTDEGGGRLMPLLRLRDFFTTGSNHIIFIEIITSLLSKTWCRRHFERCGSFDFFQYGLAMLGD